MNKIGIVKVKALQGVAKAVAEDYGLEPEDLVILTVSLEKVIGDPVSYLLSQIQSSEQKGMKVNPIVNYDEDTDVLYFNMYNPPLAADDSKRIGDFIWRYKDGKPIGLTILNFLRGPEQKEASG